jgi:23S rRNA (adenine2503-C2)-methyltransferase
MDSKAKNPVLPSIYGLLPAELQAMVVSWGWPKFRAKQVIQQVYEANQRDPDKMSNLSVADRTTLKAKLDFSLGQVVANQLSEDATRKLLIAWPKGYDGSKHDSNAETVMIPDEDRRTACVSSQVGCPVGCKFCASGVGGAKGNLTAAQIVQQVVALNEFLRPQNQRVTNIVFMGMGEPLANYQHVMKAIAILHDPECLNLGARRITLSTVGVPPKMKALADQGLPINLAISLHAPNEPLRRQLIPWADHLSLTEILNAARYYFDKTGREITLEYILLAGVNDRPEHARELSQVCQTLRANVNLLRYNEVAGIEYKRPTAEDVVRFQSVLRNNGVNAHVRKSRGRDIDAACGQLRKRAGEQPVPLIQLGTP